MWLKRLLGILLSRSPTVARSRVRNHTDAHIRLSPPRVYKEKFEKLRGNPHKTRVTSQSISEPLLHPSLPFTLYPRPETRGWQRTVRLRRELGPMFRPPEALLLVDVFRRCVRSERLEERDCSVL